MKGLVRALAAAAVLAASPLQRSASPAESPAELRLHDLHSVDDLRSAFNRDAGKVRLVLLLSPT